jgi:hypothetical protein
MLHLAQKLNATYEPMPDTREQRTYNRSLGGVQAMHSPT